MQKYSFKNDYSEGVHPNILKKLLEINEEQITGYGLDKYCDKAKELIKQRIKSENSDVYFVSGGTQTNQLVLAHILRPYESVISAKTGHINVHEAGAIEATGHKVDTIQSADGKLTPELIKPILEEHLDDHMTLPKAVYISNATELGTYYTKQEIINLSTFCKDNGLYLFLDGARLASGLMVEGNNLTIEDIAQYTDIFYIGGTKNGAMFGEALVIQNDNIKKDMFRNVKQRGALLAKGWMLGIQFSELFTDDLYFQLGKRMNELSMKLVKGISELGYSFLSDSKTNQIFPIFTNEIIERLSELYGFYVWSKVDDNTSSIRLVTSWATKEEMIDEFLIDLKNL